MNPITISIVSLSLSVSSLFPSRTIIINEQGVKIDLKTSSQVELRDESIDSKITRYSSLYGVKEALVREIIKKESSFNEKAIGDMDIICKNTGKPVRARGLVQITECHHPNINDAQAFDPDFAIEFLAKEISQGNCEKLWTTCRGIAKN